MLRNASSTIPSVVPLQARMDGGGTGDVRGMEQNRETVCRLDDRGNIPLEHDEPVPFLRALTVPDDMHRISMDLPHDDGGDGTESLRKALPLNPVRHDPGRCLEQEPVNNPAICQTRVMQVQPSVAFGELKGGHGQTPRYLRAGVPRSRRALCAPGARTRSGRRAEEAGRQRPSVSSRRSHPR